MGSPHQHQQHQQLQVYNQLYGDRAYWQFILHANNDIVLIVVFGLLIIHLLASFTLILRTFIRDKVSSIPPSLLLITHKRVARDWCWKNERVHGESREFSFHQLIGSLVALGKRYKFAQRSPSRKRILGIINLESACSRPKFCFTAQTCILNFKVGAVALC